MDRKKGVAYCGLACAVCGENADCAGCRKDGCKNKEWCKNFNCAREKGLDGCFSCEKFSERCGMLEKPRIHAFARFVKEYGEDKLLDCLEQNEKKGVVYHEKGKLTGDYDNFKTEDEIIAFILSGDKTN